MIISHNLQAMNAQRMFGNNTISQMKSTERLSSGYKINRSADDAAGLAISEKMRRQIRGLGQASLNCQEGIGLCQVRDGALNEVHDILNRMNELSVKAANGTLTDDDRSYIQTEVDQLVSEINRIGKTTTFNEIHIFDYDDPASFSGKNISSSMKALGSGYLTDSFMEGGVYYPAANLDFSAISPQNIADLNGKSFRFSCSMNCDEAFKFTFVQGQGSSNSNLSGRVEHQYNISIDGLSSGKDVLDTLFGYVKNHMPNGYTATSEKDVLVSHSNRMVRTSDETFSIVGTGRGTFPTKEQAEAVFASKTGDMGKADCNELADILYKEKEERILPIQAGAEASQYIYLTMDKMNAQILGLEPTDVSTQEASNNAISRIKSAFNIISKQRSDAGAEQNRLEHTISNLNNITENTVAAESSIRDTDMAKEMVRNANIRILLQAGEAIMAKANQTNSDVLALLG